MFIKKRKDFIIKGRVVDRRTGDGIEGLRVEGWDKDIISKNDYLGSAVTNSNGYFDLTFNESRFKELFFDRRPDLYFEVFCGEDWIASTENQVDWNISQRDYEIKKPIEVEIKTECTTAPNNRTYRVFGMVQDANDNASLTRYTVRAFDRDNQLNETQLGLAQTDQAAFYQIEFSAAAIKEVNPTRSHPNLFVRVYNEKNEKLGESIQIDNAGPITELNIDITLYRVSGTVTDSNGKFLKDKTVKVLDRDIRNSELLGITMTNAKGYYEITYNKQKFSRAEKDSADLEVHVVDGDEVIKSEIQFNAPTDTTINLVVPGSRLSEFELLLKVILPLLEGQGEDGRALTVEALQSEDAEFLAKDTSEPIERINWLIIASKLSLDSVVDINHEAGTSLNDNNPTSIPPAVFYAWLHKGLPEKLFDLQKEAPTVLRRSLLEAIDELLVPTTLKEQVDLFIALLGHPQWDAVKELINVLEIDPDKQIQLSQHFNNLGEIHDISLTSLVQSQVLTDVEADRLGLAVSLQRLTQGPANTLTPLLETIPPKLGRLLIKSDDLARLHPTDWVILITNAGITPPVNKSIEEYASDLEEIAVNAFPTIGLLHRSARMPDSLDTSFNLIKPRFSSIKKLWGKSICSICDSNSSDSDPLVKLWELPISDSAFPEIVSSLSLEQQQAIGEIKNFVRVHPGLDASLPLGELQEASIAWVEYLDELIRINENQDLIALDYSVLADEPPKINFANLPRDPLVRELTSMQRMLVLAETPTKAQALMQAGLHSATQMALLPREVLMANTGMDNAEIVRLHERAKTQANQTAVAYFSAKDSAQTLRMFSSAVGIGEAGKIDVVQKLFGNLDACECAHCLSVLSPAAYFVDLMYYVESSISAPKELNRSLETRRSDLWDLPLSCDNTNTIVPTLDIVNRILESWLKQVLQVASSAEVFNKIAAPEAITSFNLPVNFPLQRLEILLAHFGLSRDRVARVLEWKEQRIQTRLQLTADEVSVITLPKTTNMSIEVRNFFARLYDISESELHSSNADALISESTSDLSHFQHITKIDRNVLRTLILCQFVSKDGSTNNPIKVVMLAAEGDVQNNIERVQNLSLRRLDRLHRMTRLWRKLPWSVSELDYVLIRLAEDHSLGLAELTPDILGDIVNLLDLADRTRLPVDELLSLVGAIPSIGLRGDGSLFDRKFNIEPFVTRDGLWPNTLPPELKHPAFSPEGVSDPDKSTLMRLLAALQIDDSQFLSLVQGLAILPVDGSGNTLLTKINPGGPDEHQVIKLTLISLQFLYRYARLASILGIKIPELLQLVRLALKVSDPADSNQFIKSISDLKAALDFADKRQASGYELEQIEWLLDSDRTPTGTRATPDIAAAVVRRIAQERLLIVSTATLTVMGLTELESTQALKQLSQTMLDVSDQENEYRFKPAVVFDAIATQIETNLSATFDFDVAAVSILSFARHLGEFEDTVFKDLYLDVAESKRIVMENLASTAEPDKAFEEIQAQDLSTNPAKPAKYRINPLFQPTTLSIRVVLADTIVRGFLEKISNSGPHIILETVFQEIYLTAQQSRWLVVANTETGESASKLRPFLKNPGTNGLLINPQFFITATSQPELELKKLVTRHIVTLLQRYHWQSAFDLTVGAELNIEAEKIAAFRTYNMPTNDIVEILLGLKNVNTNPFANWIAQAQRLQCLLKESSIDTAAVREILTYWPVLTATPSPKDLWNQILSTATYARWLKVVMASGEKAKSRRLSLENLLHTTLLETLEAEDVANVLGVPVETIQSANNIKPVPGEWFQQLDQWSLIVEITTRLGVSGETLYRMLPVSSAATEVNNLWRAADDIHGAFRAKYLDVATYQKKAETFEDVIRGKRRDALVAFLLDTQGFQGSSHLYAYFLIDVEVGGCARTSELVAATTSLQLYVHRVLMGLEMSNASERVSFKDDGGKKRREWSWRKHYRVWEANRKVFLFPENFIEPDLRDDKTPLFRDLEDELLQRQINMGEAEESYAKYLTGFSEVASLKIVGAFHDVEADVMHLVGVTESEPPLHYLRQIYNLKSNDSNAGLPMKYTAWERLSAQIPVKWVSPVLFQRKLMLFWVEINTSSTTQKLSGMRVFDGYQHKFKVKWIERESDGSWTSPQQMYFLNQLGNLQQTINDPLVFVRSKGNSEDPSSFPFVLDPESPMRFFTTTFYKTLLRKLDGDSSYEMDLGISNIKLKATPKHADHNEYNSVVPHNQPIENYSLNSYIWERVFPTIRYSAASETLQICAMNLSVHGFMSPGERRISFIAGDDIEIGKNNLLAAHMKYSFSISEPENKLFMSSN